MCYQPNPNEMSFDEPEIAGAFGRKLKRGLKKMHVAPLKLIHKATHGKNSPIRKMEEAMQKVVGKALPFTKPFIQAHNQVSNQTYKVFEKAGVLKRGDTHRIGAGAQKGSPQGAATRLAASVQTGKSLLAPAEIAALRNSPSFRKQALTHLAAHASNGNAAAADTIARLYPG